MKITIFSEELRKCLNDAGLSDCGENDTWNYWYQRLMNAYNESVERQIMTEQADNAELREQVDAAHMSRLLTENENESLRELVAKYSAAAKYLCGFSHCNECNLDCASVFGDVPSGWDCARMLLDKKARELGVEVD